MRIRSLSASSSTTARPAATARAIAARIWPGVLVSMPGSTMAPAAAAPARSRASIRVFPAACPEQAAAAASSSAQNFPHPAGIPPDANPPAARGGTAPDQLGDHGQLAGRSAGFLPLPRNQHPGQLVITGPRAAAAGAGDLLGERGRRKQYTGSRGTVQAMRRSTPLAPAAKAAEATMATPAKAAMATPAPATAANTTTATKTTVAAKAAMAAKAAKAANAAKATVATAALALVAAACTSAGTGQPASNTAAPTSAATASGASPSATASATTAPGTTASSAASAGAAAPGALPRPAHTLVVMLENHGYGQVIGSPDAPFINSLAGRGALFTNAHAVTHPSEPNYLALFSGSTQRVTDDSCPHQFSAPNLATGLLAARDTFAGYSENLPGTGSPVCAAAVYARKHVPWTNFSNVPSSVSQPFGAFPAGDFARLPTVSFVIPNICDDMHDCSVAVGDSWLRAHIGPYAAWAMTHDSLLIVAWDENDGSQGNQIPLIFAGQMVRPGRYGQPVTHYSVLSTIEAAYRVPRTGHAASTGTITGIWK